MLGSPDDPWADTRENTSGVTVPESIVLLMRVFLDEEADADATLFSSVESGPPQDGKTLQQDDSPKEQIVRINKCRVVFMIDTNL